MQLVERHIIKDNRFEEICYRSGLLYNFVTYHYRQAIFGKQEYFDEYEMSGLCAEFNQEDYRRLPIQTSQQVIKQVFKNFKSWQRSKKEFEKNPGKFKGKPRLPGFKTGSKQNLVIFTNQSCSLKQGSIYFPKKCNLQPIKTKQVTFQQVRVIPQATCHVVEIVYNTEINNLKLDQNNFLSIDLGLNNYCTALSNVVKPFIINGRVIKSFNHWYNKKKSKLQSYIGDRGTSRRLQKLNNYRNFWIEDKNHKISRHIINHCIENNIGTVIIGHNKSWKNEINLGRKTNQKFVEIPHSKLIDKIKYKAELLGIKILLTEESYTSKIDHLSFEPLCKREIYLGKRKKRGLFQSSTGKLLNADINGCLGIQRKVFGDSRIKEITDSGFVLNPEIIKVI